MNALVTMRIFFLDGSMATFKYRRQSGKDQAAIVSAVKKAIESERLVLEADGDLVVIPIRSVKYVRVSPAPPHLPAGILRAARMG